MHAVVAVALPAVEAFDLAIPAPTLSQGGPTSSFQDRNGPLPC